MFWRKWCRSAKRLRRLCYISCDRCVRTEHKYRSTALIIPSSQISDVVSGKSVTNDCLYAYDVAFNCIYKIGISGIRLSLSIFVAASSFRNLEETCLLSVSPNGNVINTCSSIPSSDDIIFIFDSNGNYVSDSFCNLCQHVVAPFNDVFYVAVGDELTYLLMTNDTLRPTLTSRGRLGISSTTGKL